MLCGIIYTEIIISTNLRYITCESLYQPLTLLLLCSEPAIGVELQLKKTKMLYSISAYQSLINSHTFESTKPLYGHHPYIVVRNVEIGNK